jgi:hypothetical protein
MYELFYLKAMDFSILAFLIRFKLLFWEVVINSNFSKLHIWFMKALIKSLLKSKKKWIHTILLHSQ